MVSAEAKLPAAPTGELGEWSDAAGSPAITLRLPEEWVLSDACVVALGELNDCWSFERSAEGALVIGSPPGNLNSERGGVIFGQILNWRFASGGGRSAPADGGFHLPDGALLVPDASWVSDERLAGIESEDEGVWSVVPDFVLEVRSRSQDVKDQQEKMEQWMANGVRLGWLLDPFEGEVWIYREGEDEPELLERPAALSGESVMEGLSVELGYVWPQRDD